MKKVAIVLLGLTMLSSCSLSSDESGGTSGEKIITSNDFESLAGWVADPASLDRGRAHSGQYAIKVDRDHEYSLTFDTALGLATPTKIKTVHLEAWAFLPTDKSTGVLAIQVRVPASNEQVFGGGIKLGEVVKSRKEWVRVSQDFTLPDTIAASHHIRLFLWRADSSDEVLIDDVKLSIKN